MRDNHLIWLMVITLILIVLTSMVILGFFEEDPNQDRQIIVDNDILENSSVMCRAVFMKIETLIFMKEC
ncbi:hypothetical protein [Natranaerobius trueperi]|uniref:Uncharacterized protein n=1 Tax=Natranaerobius trueperi TaxID=759412 RepID=A0A226C0M8_9FIRM|nr:hypothetical protein [Natranaerobius trueperi]OWZ84786.1 hypothetical protein CDO51_01850 [Natranaerobius trueperi]